MQQTPAAPEVDALRRARSELIKSERARQRLGQVAAVALINQQRVNAGQEPISRGYFANIERCEKDLPDPLLRCVAAALAIQEARLRHPLNELWATAC